MSGSVAEALLASGSKKLPLLPPPPKLKKEPKTFTFNLELAESNDQSYPEFSWTELLRNAKQNEISKKAESGNTVLDPFASDDEEDLKAMAARFEAKYNNTTTAPPANLPKKKKRRLEDFIDRGAGYDETDPFIDNSDVYDEVVPPDLQPVHGGFYINSGSLDFKEVELSEDEEDSVVQAPKVPKVNKAKTKITNPNPSGNPVQKEKNPPGRPPGSGQKRLMLNEKGTVPKKKRMIITPVGPDGKAITKHIKHNNPSTQTSDNSAIQPARNPTDNSKQLKVVNISSSSSSSSSSSGDSSSSSESESSSSEETEEKTKPVKTTNVVKAKPAVPSTTVPKLETNLIRKLEPGMPSLVAQNPNPIQPKRLKTKNVPLNPKLHPNLSATPPLSSAGVTTITPVSNTTPQAKLINKDLIKANGGGGSRSASPRTQSPSGIISIPTSSPAPAHRVSTPKPTTTPSLSPGLTISAVNTQANKPSNNIQQKQKVKPKPAVANVPTMSSIEIFNSIASYSGLSSLPNLNFSPALSPNSSLMKGGMSLMSSSKAMPNLKKISPSEKLLVQKQPKAGIQKPVKQKPKQTFSNTSATASLLSGSSMNNHFITNLTSYKTPPPLVGPGVEISKLRTSSNNSISKASPMSVLSTSTLSLGTVSPAHSSISPSQLSLTSSGINSILSASQTLVSSVPSSLTMSRLPQSITITPSPQTSFSAGDRMSGSIPSSRSSNLSSHLMDPPKPIKHISAYDVSALLQQTPVSYPNQGVMGSSAIISKSSTGKTQNSIVIPRDFQRK